MNRRRLSDILQTSAERERLRQAWSSTEAADDFAIIPAGEYVAEVTAGEYVTGRTNGTLGYKLTFRLIECDYAGRLLWYDIWLSAAALPLAKRDLGKLGVTDFDLLDRPLPPGIVCKLRVVVRRDDDGAERNRVKSFEVLRVEQPKPDPFAPKPSDLEHGDADRGAA